MLRYSNLNLNIPHATHRHRSSATAVPCAPSALREHSRSVSHTCQTDPRRDRRPTGADASKRQHAHTSRLCIAYPSMQAISGYGTASRLVHIMRCLLPPVQSCSRAAHKPTRACARHVSRSSGRMAKNPASTTTHIEQPVRAASPARPAARSRNATSETSDAAHAHNGLHRLINIVANGR